MCLRLVCEVTRLVVHGDVWACGGIGDDLEIRNGRDVGKSVSTLLSYWDI